MSSACPCGSGKAFAACCEPLLRGDAAVTAEQLMRSRYTAYILRDRDYLLRTWQAGTRPADLALDESPAPKWIGLRIVETERGGENDDEGQVEFIARYAINGRAFRLHERSRFVREAGRWVYVDGEMKGKAGRTG